MERAAGGTLYKKKFFFWAAQDYKSHLHYSSSVWRKSFSFGLHKITKTIFTIHPKHNPSSVFHVHVHPTQITKDHLHLSPKANPYSIKPSSTFIQIKPKWQRRPKLALNCAEICEQLWCDALAWTGSQIGDEKQILEASDAPAICTVI